ncbi:MAG: DUF3256 family protein [Paludibacteraceae bacterium]|nr:DUF3256 family protein [Paludibacteraceae bacterium]
MRKAITILLLFFTFEAYSIDAFHCFRTIPDTIFPFAEMQQRNYMLFSPEKESCCVNNAFNGVTCLKEHTPMYVRIEVGDDISYEILIESDSTWLFINTACAPVCSSIVRRFYGSWDRGEKVAPDIHSQFVKAEVIDGNIVYSDQTYLLRDDEERKEIKQ